LKNKPLYRNQFPGVLFLFFLLATSFFALAESAEAGSLIRSHLATVDELRIRVSTGGMSYDRIPNLELKTLAQSIYSASLRQFQDCGIATLKDAPVSLYVSISKKGIPPLPNHVVILIDYELAEPAHLLRASPAGDDSPTTVTSWRQNRALISKKSEAMATIMESVTWVVEDLAQTIIQARRHVAGNTEEPGEPCFKDP